MPCFTIRFRTSTIAGVTAVLALAASPALAAKTHRHSRRHAHGTTACANANAAASHVSRAALKASVTCLINEQRTARGLPALNEDSRLDRSAQGWTATMVATGQFTHGSDFASRISAAGYDWSSAGENIATGFATPQQVVRAWMASPGHCQNILNPQYSSVGTGVVDRPIAPFSTGPATWTQDFALQMGSRAPSDNWGPYNSDC